MIPPTAAATGDARVVPGDFRHPLTLTLLGLTFGTGVIDAVCYLGLGRVFSANMTGNVVLLGFGIARSGGLPVIAPLVSLAAFLLGATAGGRLAGAVANRRRSHVLFTLAGEAGLLGIATVFAVIVPPHPRAVSGDAVIALLALAMGLRNATVRKLAVPDLTTTVLTLTLTGLAADSPLAGGSGRGSGRRIAAAMSLLVGAVAGALLEKVAVTVALAAATGLAVLSGAGYFWAAVE